MKRILLVFLTICIVFLTFFVFDFSHINDHGRFSYGGIKGTEIIVKYHCDVGFQQGWKLKDSNGNFTWNKVGSVDVAPGNTINVTTTVDVSNLVPEGGALIEAKAMTIASSGFHFIYGSDTYSFNPTPKLGGQITWDENYSDYTAEIDPSQIAVINGTNVTFKYDTKLLTSKKYSIRDQIEYMAQFMEAFGYLERPTYYDAIKGNFADFPLFLLLGGEASFKSYRPDLYDNFMRASLSVYDKLMGYETSSMMDGDTEAYMWFTPVVLELRIEVPVEDLCDACGHCPIDRDIADVCTPESCPVFGTDKCGCYAPEIIIPPDSAGCKADAIQWSEVQTHTYTVPCPIHGSHTRTCNHVYTYRTVLTSTASLEAANPNGSSSTFKSGYAFSVRLNNSISTSQISDSGRCGVSRAKANSKIPQPPLNGYVQTSWTVSNTDTKSGATQPMTITLQQDSLSANASSFSCAPNNISNYNKRLIYTDVALAGTKAAPQTHAITVHANGGGVPGVAEFCKSHTLSFIINGNMYEDFSTVDSLPQ